jgi:hypothetical protein
MLSAPRARVFVVLRIKHFDSFAMTRVKNLAFSVVSFFNNRRRVKLVLKDIEFIRCPYVLIF